MDKIINYNNPKNYEGIFSNFQEFWRESCLANKQVIFWFEGLQPEPYWGYVVGMTVINNGNDLLLHLKVSNEGDMIFIPLSTALGKRGMEIRVQNDFENNKDKDDNKDKKEDKNDAQNKK